MEGDMLRVHGDNRMYLVEDHRQTIWGTHKYVRLDLNAEPLKFTLDLSGVPCGCLACVYLVAMADPEWGGDANYCDSAPCIVSSSPLYAQTYPQPLHAAEQAVLTSRLDRAF